MRDPYRCTASVLSSELLASCLVSSAKKLADESQTITKITSPKRHEHCVQFRIYTFSSTEKACRSIRCLKHKVHGVCEYVCKIVSVTRSSATNVMTL